MNPVPDADGAPSPLLSNQDRKEVEKQYEDAEKRLHRAAKNLDEATSNEETADQLKQVHHQSLRMLIYGAHLGKPKDEMQNLLNELLLKNPSTPQPKSIAVDTLSPLEVALVYRHLASPDLLENLAITGESPIGDIARSIVKTALIGTPTLLNALKDDDEVQLTEEVVGQYSFEQLFFLVHMLGRLAFLDSTLSKRRAFMDQLVESVFETLALSLADAVDLPRFAEYFASIYNARQDEYSKYQESWSREESAKNTLLWEYGKRMVALVSARTNALKVAIVGNLAVQYIYDLMPFVRNADTGESCSTE